jgi:hypothetical protein
MGITLDIGAMMKRSDEKRGIEPIYQGWEPIPIADALDFAPGASCPPARAFHSPPNCKENAEQNVEARRRRRRNVEILGGGRATLLASVRRGGAAITKIAS